MVIWGFKLKTQVNLWNREDVEKVWSIVEANGIDCLGDLVNSTQLDPRIVVGIVEQQHIDLGLSLDSLAREGMLSLRDMSRITSIGCYEQVRKELIEKKLHKVWKKARRRFISGKKEERSENKDLIRARKQVLEEIVNVVSGSIVKKLREDSNDWAYRKTLDYFMENTVRTLVFEDILEFLRRYKSCQDQGTKRSLMELSKGLSISYTVAGRILSSLDLKPLYGTKEWVILTKDDKSRIQRAYSIEMPATDLAYFLGLPLNKVIENFKDIGKRRQCRVITCLDGSPLTYRIASQIFMAKDAGYTDEEVMSEFNMSQRLLNYFYRNKKDLKETIINALRVIYKDHKVSKPYL